MRKTSSKTDHPAVQAFAANLAKARHRAGLTQVQVADKAGISVAYVSLLERGGRNPPLTQVADLAEAIGTTTERLVHTAG